MDFNQSLAHAVEAVDDRQSAEMMSSALAWLQHKPANPREVYEQARILFAFAQFEAALGALAQAVETNEVAELRRASYEHLAHWLLETGDLARAEWAAEHLLREAGNDFRAWSVRGEIASLRGDDATALECFHRALQTLPRDYSATEEQARAVGRLLYLRVAALVRLRRYAEALEDWRAAVERDSENADLWYLGAVARAQSGRADEALRCCERAMALDPRHLDAGKLKRQLSRTA